MCEKEKQSIEAPAEPQQAISLTGKRGAATESPGSSGHPWRAVSFRRLTGGAQFFDWIRLVAFLLPGLFLPLCNGSSIVSGSSNLQAENETLRVSKFHQEAFVPITKNVYD